MLLLLAISGGRVYKRVPVDPDVQALDVGWGGAISPWIWAPCQPLSDSSPPHRRWRIFVSETNGTERINYHHDGGDVPELEGGGSS